MRERAGQTPSSSSPSSWRCTCGWRGGGAFDVALLDEREGFAALRISGRGAASLAETEPGGHRIQRVPANEKRGRVHSSSITVAVLPEATGADAKLDLREVVVTEGSGTGSGGQARNKSMCLIRAVHVPTGIEAKAESERSQKQNKVIALEVLAARVAAHRRATAAASRANERKQQVGSGMRGDKVRTLRFQDDVVTCERTGRKARLKDYLKGDFDWLS